MAASLEDIEAIFHRALAIPDADRRAFLNVACAGNPDLIGEVEALLRHNNEQTVAFEAAVQPVASDLLPTTENEAGIAPGALLGPYRIERKLGEGGMGSVYLATDTRLGRKVAVKLVSPALARTPEARARFLREARSAAALSHSSIAMLHDFGETAETLWLVMEYVSGASLRSRLMEPVGEIAWRRYASEIAAAFEHAHDRRMIHRDIKPENILITDEDHIKVIDFGLARAVHDSAPSSAITRPNAFVGTLAYAAPELLAGGSASARSDVYSLGVVLYEMACGEQPFARLTGPALVSAILSGSYTACSAKGRSLSPGITAIVDRCMSREPAARYKSASELAAALRELDTAHATVQTDPGPPMLAIIDFKNIGASSDLDWLGTGIAETLSADLAKVKTVRVANRGRVVQVLRRLGSPENDASSAIELGRELGARWIVTGAYQQVADRIRVTSALTDARTGAIVATEKTDGRWADLFEVQDRVVAALLNALTIGFDVTDQLKIVPVETRDLLAYEHYVRGRESMYQMNSQSLSTAIHYFEQAVALDPDYALAYSGIGTAHALRFIGSSNPEDIVRASRYLERAIELDPELGEPYPWLANIRFRQNDPSGAAAAARKGVELQPDLPEAHYFFGGIHYMAPEFEPGALRTSAAHLAISVRLRPKYPVAWLVLGAAVAFLGQHKQAIRVLVEGARVECDPDIFYHFVGAETVLGIVQTRAGSWDTARAQHLRAMESLRTVDHVYTPSFLTLSACGLGEVELRCGNASAAAAHFRHARRLISESRRMLGSPRLLVRANAGLAAAYAAEGDLARARELAEEAAAHLQSAASEPATAMFECSLAQLNLILAATQARLGEIERAAAFLDRSRKLGWMDLAWLRADPELRLLHGHPVFESFAEELASAPPVDIPPVVFPHTGGSHSASETG